MDFLDVDEPATEEWVKALPPELVGLIGRGPTRQERRHWLRESEKTMARLVALRIKLLTNGSKNDFVRYLRLRQACGYIEGVPIPAWIWDAMPEKAKSPIIIENTPQALRL